VSARWVFVRATPNGSRQNQDGWRPGAYQMSPSSWRPRGRRTIEEMAVTLKFYIRVSFDGLSCSIKSNSMRSGI